MESKIRNDDEIEIDLKEIFLVIKKKILTVIAAGLLCGCLACGFTMFVLKPVYTSTSTILVMTKETTLSSFSDLQMEGQLTNDYCELIVSRPVLEEVIENLKLDMDYKKFREIISIDNSSDSRIIHISVKNRDAELAARIVNELSYVSADFFGDSMEVAPPKIIDEGEIPTEKTSPSMIKNTIMGILAGILLTCVILTVMTVTDDTIKSEDGIEKYLGIPVLASIPDRQDYISSGRKNKKRKRK